MTRATDYTECPSSEAMDWLSEQATQHAIDAGIARQRIVREERAACARKGR